MSITDPTEETVDVTKTFESGALYHWWKRNGWYETTIDGGFLRVREDGDGLAYESECVGDTEVARFLGTGDDLDEVEEAMTDDDVTEEVYEKHRGLRVPREEPFACTLSFIASAQSRNERTRGVIRRLCERHGEKKEGWAAHTFPSAKTVSRLGEEELRDVGFGYRAPYIAETARTVADGDVRLERLRDESYSEAHEELKRLKGVGDKVADCVLLFSLGFVGVVALDTWLKRIISELYPELEGETYEETARGFREHFDGYGGYAQTYLYHEARTGDLGL